MKSLKESIGMIMPTEENGNVKEEWHLIIGRDGIYEFESLLFDIITVRIRASNEEQAWKILNETVK